MWALESAVFDATHARDFSGTLECGHRAKRPERPLIC